MKLFEPIKIGKVSVKNRIVMAPMTNHFADKGFVTERMVSFYEARARGGSGLITIEDAIVDYPIGNNTANPLAIDHEKYIPMLKKLSSTIKSHGCVPMVQLSHAGRRAGRVNPDTGCIETTQHRLPVAPSALAHPFPGHVVPRVLRVEEIEAITEKFVQGARRAVEAGFDIVGLHCAHMYLIGQFLSPWANKRMDDYGGTLENRMRFIINIIRRIKREIGEDFPLVCRMNGAEPEGGNTLREIQDIAVKLQSAGINALHVSVGFGPVLWEKGFMPAEAPIGMPEGCIVNLAENIKRVVTIPVITVNKIRHVDFAENILQRKRADMIALGRALLADPMWPYKAMNNKAAEIRPCVSCCQGCVKNIETGNPISCLANPLVGREYEIMLDRVPPDSVKKILVIGGGPAGLMTAIIAAKRGHKVSIWEKENRLGGEMHLAMMPPRKQEFRELMEYLIFRVNSLGIEVKLNTLAGARTVGHFDADAVVVAIGSETMMPTIAGIENSNVISAIKAFEDEANVGAKVVIIGGGLIGLEAAESFSQKGKAITIVEIKEDVGSNMPMLVKIPLLITLQERGVNILTGSSVRKIDLTGVEVEHGGTVKFLDCETVIIASGGKSNHSLEEQIRSAGKNVYSVGSSNLLGDMLAALHNGFHLGAQL
ncbi:NADH:flavin oxidoreductase, Old Yellow Enzyme family [uncultured Desulfobacterium sp.]|uniref:NADH:flavin oxidoreductase, Old Yellow Enzyme family n=1 Tax=uncultured Desulfobacterium sp. TaxID=201089 RepID=A0A445MQI0_9BACT|nr:NADH:flavin oxidoreductase, Old Yellow Enzyme family [uncultured Desulfobacterium sp.]